MAHQRLKLERMAERWYRKARTEIARRGDDPELQRFAAEAARLFGER